MKKIILLYIAICMTIAMYAQDTITVAQALQIGSTLTVGQKTEVTYYIEGYVSSLVSTTQNFMYYGDKTYWITDDPDSNAASNADGAFQVYRGVSTNDINVGDKVGITTQIHKYTSGVIESVKDSKVTKIFATLHGTCGENLTWSLDTITKTLTIGGYGDMITYYYFKMKSVLHEPDEDIYERRVYAPWLEYKQLINSVLLPEGLTNIGEGAFAECIGLKSIVIPTSVTSIDKSAFSGCANLTSITLPDNVTSIGETAFSGCAGLTSLTIPNNVTSIGRCAFLDCAGLTSITIPHSVTSIGSWLIEGCTSLTSINVAAESETFCSIDGVLFNKDKTILILFPFGRKGTYIIPNGTTSIAYGAFAGSRWGDGPYVELTSITLPNSVISIGDYAFSRCGLTNITIPNSVKKIGCHAFAGCSGLTSISIPSSVDSIGAGAFNAGVSSVYNYAPTPQVVMSNNTVTPNNILAASGMSEEEFYKLYVPIESINLYKSTAAWNCLPNILPIIADSTDVTIISVESTETTATIAWPQINGAYSYELVIRDANGNVVCTLVFDAEGHLLSFTFNAPSKDHAPQQLQSAGFAFTVTGLNSGSTYSYTLIAKNESGATLNTETGTFTTASSPQTIEDIQADQQPATKILRNGQIYIRRGDKKYSIVGSEL